MGDCFGTGKVDAIEALIDEALSGYETQHAGFGGIGSTDGTDVDQSATATDSGHLGGIADNGWRNVAAGAWRRITGEPSLPDSFDEFTTIPQLAGRAGVPRETVEEALDWAAPKSWVSWDTTGYVLTHVELDETGVWVTEVFHMDMSASAVAGIRWHPSRGC